MMQSVSERTAAAKRLPKMREAGPATAERGIDTAREAARRRATHGKGKTFRRMTFTSVG
jgi:hypothetical protein